MEDLLEFFYGNNHEIQDIYMNYSTGPVGLFRTAGSNSLIRDLSITGTAILSNDTSSAAYVAGIVGVAHGTFTITNCNNKVTTKIENSSHGAGGLIGGTATDAIINMDKCSNQGVISSSENAGGLIGYKATGGSVTINSSNNEGTVNGANATGGILGYINKSTSITITDCYNNGEVTNTGTKGTGDIVGFEDTDGTLTITRCNNTKKITGSSNVGGIIGYSTAGCTVENNSNNADIESTTESGTSGMTGGIAGRNGGTIKKSYNDGSISSKKNCTGGIAGSNPGVIELCFNNGIINTTGSSGTGGITGYQNYSTARTSNCYNMKTINGKGDIGGIVGNNGTGTVENSYNTGVINGTAQVGSIVGRNQAAGQITKSYYLNSLTTPLYGLNSGNVDALSSALSQADMTSTDKTKFVDLLNSGQTEEVWQLDTNINQGYPILKWQTEQ